MTTPIKWDELPIVKREMDIILKEYIARNESAIFLDVGGTAKYWNNRPILIKDYTRIPLNLVPLHAKKGICGDICKVPIKDNSVDIIFSRNVFEHIKEPWKAAEECVRIIKPGGLTIHMAPFAWRYHISPVDYYRYSHEGLAYLFERTGKVDRIVAGYCSKRLAKRNKKDKKKNLAYWAENWISVYIGRKKC